MLPSPITAGDRRSATIATIATAFHPYTHQPSPTPTKTMEEVWKDINLPCLHDFLNRPSSDQQPSSTAVAPVPIPATVLSLNSGPELYFPSDDHHQIHHHHHQQQQQQDGDSPTGHLVISGDGGGDHFGPFDALASSVLVSFGKKRFADATPVDRRHKRMMKNRESAARSRARKQAYINQMQLEIDNLTAENIMLKEKQKKKQNMEEPCHQDPKEYLLQRLLAEPVLHQPHKKNQLKRTSTARF